MKAVTLNTELTGLFARLVPLMQQQPAPPVTDSRAQSPVQPRTALHLDANRSGNKCRCKVWILWKDGRSASFYPNPDAPPATVIASWQRRLAIGGTWHSMGYQLARIYTTEVPGDFLGASYTEIKP
jgi:hypothetical protein